MYKLRLQCTDRTKFRSLEPTWGLHKKTNHTSASGPDTHHRGQLGAIHRFPGYGGPVRLPSITPCLTRIFKTLHITPPSLSLLSQYISSYNPYGPSRWEAALTKHGSFKKVLKWLTLAPNVLLTSELSSISSYQQPINIHRDV